MYPLPVTTKTEGRRCKFTAKGERMLTYTSCNLQRNNEKNQKWKCYWTGQKMDM